MAPPIEVFLQPPSPTINSCKLPSVKSLFPVSSTDDENNNSSSQQLPSIRLTNHSSDNEEDCNSNNDFPNSPRLNTIEPHLDLSSIATSPYQSSPIMTFSSPSSATSSIMGSPLISPIQDCPFLLPPPDNTSFRRCRSASNASNISDVSLSPSASPLTSHFIFRSLSEPPTLNLPTSASFGEEEEEDEEKRHSIFGPKRKRGRPPNASRPEIQSDSNFTFVKPTVWDVKQQKNVDTATDTPTTAAASSTNYNTFTTTNSNNKNTQNQFYTENNIMSDGINTFTTTNMDMALSMPKKKRGRKPKKQLAGNSCFVWKDLTAPRGANKKSPQVPAKNSKSSPISSSSGDGSKSAQK